MQPALSLKNSPRKAEALPIEIQKADDQSAIRFFVIYTPADLCLRLGFYYLLLSARSVATAIATVAPTIGLLPIPRKPIIST